ncbi:hypothetical protein BH10BAC1_BH10BAC1_15180 [soil metagenome]
MKKIYFPLFIFAILTSIQLHAQYSSQNISLLGHWWNPAQPPEPSYGIKYNSVWGWVDTADSNREYAILGSGLGTHIIDVSNPSSPIEVDFVPGRRSSVIWREYKTYGKYLYAVSDDVAPNSLQIMDLSYLPDSVKVVYDDNALFERSHTIYIDGDKLYGGSVTLASGAGYHQMAIYSLANPEAPTFLHSLITDYPSCGVAHDMLVRNDTVYASMGYAGFFIYTYNPGTNTFTELNSLVSYPDNGYNHSSTMTPDGKTLVFCDEVPANKSVHVVDLTDVFNLNIPSMFKSNEGATAHNPYMYGSDRVVIAYYQDGLQIFDISNTALPTRTGYFDTDTLHGLNDNYPTTDTYHGAWGAYVDLPSGNILVGDMQNGLYILDASLALGIRENNIGNNNISVFPNPASNYFSISLKFPKEEDVLFELFDVSGRKIFSKKETIGAGNTTKTVHLDQYEKGMYVLKISGKNIQYSQKVIKQ